MKALSLTLLLALSVAAIFWPSGAFAANCDTKSCTGLIDRLYMAPDRLYVQMNGSKPNWQCKTVTNRQYFYVLRSHPQFSEWHGMLLGAFLAERPALVRVEPGQNNECNILYVVLDR